MRFYNVEGKETIALRHEGHFQITHSRNGGGFKEVPESELLESLSWVLKQQEELKKAEQGLRNILSR